MFLTCNVSVNYVWVSSLSSLFSFLTTLRPFYLSHLLPPFSLLFTFPSCFLTSSLALTPLPPSSLLRFLAFLFNMLWPLNSFSLFLCFFLLLLSHHFVVFVTLIMFQSFSYPIAGFFFLILSSSLYFFVSAFSYLVSL